MNAAKTALGVQILGGAGGAIFLCWVLTDPRYAFRQDFLLEYFIWGSLPAIFFGVQAWRQRRWAFMGSLVLSLGLLATQALNLFREWGHLHGGEAIAEMFLALNGLQALGLAIGIYACTAPPTPTGRA